MTESADRRVNLRLRALFDGAMDLEPGARDSYLAHECGDDVALLTQVRHLLAANARADSFLEHPPVFALPPNLSPGRRLGPYALIRELGRGGMGVVYLAKRIDGQFEREVAVKVVSTGARALETSRRFLKNARFLPAWRTRTSRNCTTPARRTTGCRTS